MILVTGGAGFIGSHTCVALQNAGYDLVIADNFSNAGPSVPEHIRTITGKAVSVCPVDVCDLAAMRAVFAQYPIDGVIHFAGYKAVGESIQKPREYYRNNVGSTLTLLQAMEESGCKRLVFSSSATVYGEHNPSPYTEDMPVTVAANPYGQTKIVQEQILTDVATADPEMRVALLRYFNPVGAHPSGLIGEDPNGTPNNLMPYISRVAAGVLPELRIFGWDYPTPDGTGMRDYIHVMDLAEGHVAALDYLKGHPGVLTVNLGTGKATSVLEMVAAFEAACGKKIPLRFEPRRAGDLAAYYADASRAKTLLNWQATRSIEDMCRDAWNYTKNHR